MGYYCDSSQKRMNVHSCIAVTESGIALGMVHQESHTREKQKSGTKKGYQTKSRAMEEKENFRWINTARIVQQQISAVDTDMDCLLVCDREGDFYELFAECVNIKLPVLVRLTQNRSLKETVQKEGKILDALRAMEPAGTMEVKVSRNPAKKEQERTAVMEYQFGRFELKKPVIRREKELPESVSVSAVFVHERKGVENEEVLHWFLLTTEKISNAKEAERIIQDYIARWKIECFHHVLKSGCKIEEKQARSYKSLTILTVLYSVIIILSLTYMGRVCPNLPAGLIFTEEECDVLYHAANKTKEKTKQTYTISEAVNDLAVLGGRKGAPSDGFAGVNSIWRGLRCLGILLEYASFVL